MSHAFRGRPLELAIARAGRAYRKAGRAIVVRQQPNVGTGDNGELIYTSGAPIDFLGAHGAHAGGRGIALEAKETSSPEGFKLEKLGSDQRAALALFEGMGADVSLVIDFGRVGEVYRVAWARIVEFLAAPWRNSLSLDWARAYGWLVPETDRGNDERRTLFLDWAPHPDEAAARARVEAERRSSPVITLDDEIAAQAQREEKKSKKQQALAARLAARPDRNTDPEGYQRYLLGLVDEGMQRQVEAAKRSFGKKRR